MKKITGPLTAIALMLAASPSLAQGLTEQQARLKAAEFLHGPMFSQDRSSHNIDKPVPEILNHIRDSLLVVRGDTHYCGVIKEPTWLLLLDHEAIDWFGGYPLMINARTGKVLDCRS